MKDNIFTNFIKKHGIKILALILAIALIISLANINVITSLFSKDDSDDSASSNNTLSTDTESTSSSTLELEEALAIITEQITADPENADLYVKRAAVYYNLGKSDEAIADYTTALSLKEDPQTRYLRAMVYSTTGKSQAAYDDLKIALESKPDDKDYMSLMADTCNALKKYDEALSILETLLANDPENCTLHTLAGDACVYMEDFEKAIPHYEKAIEHFSDKDEKSGISKANLYSAYGNSLKTVERYKEAAAAYDNSLKLKDNKELYFQRGFCLLQSENYADAVTDFTKSIELEYETVFSHFQRALCYYALEKYTEAIADFKVYEEKYPDKTDSWLYMGLCYQLTKDYKTAIGYYQKCIEKEISQGSCYYNIGNCHYNLEAYSDAVDSFTEAISTNSYVYESLLNRGICYIKLNKYNEAKVDLKRVMDECEDETLVKNATESYEPIKNITIITKK